MVLQIVCDIEYSCTSAYRQHEPYNRVISETVFDPAHFAHSSFSFLFVLANEYRNRVVHDSSDTKNSLFWFLAAHQKYRVLPY